MLIVFCALKNLFYLFTSVLLFILFKVVVVVIIQVPVSSVIYYNFLSPLLSVLDCLLLLGRRISNKLVVALVFDQVVRSLLSTCHWQATDEHNVFCLYSLLVYVNIFYFWKSPLNICCLTFNTNPFKLFFFFLNSH